MGGMNEDVITIGLLDDDDIALDKAALALSALDHDGIDIDPYLALLEEIDDRLAVVGRDAKDPLAQAEALSRVFYQEFGFEGDAESYDAPLNADLIRVLDRRRGLPVSLSILYVAAARRMGWTAHALNTPGHVLVRIGDEEAVLVDPFHGGLDVTPARLETLLQGALGPGVRPEAEHFAAMSNRMVLVRLLLNQASRAERDGDPLRALTLYERMTTAAPENPDGWWELARLQLQLHDSDSARGSLSAMLEITRDPERRQLVSAALEALA